MPAFLQPSFPPQVPVKHHVPVCRLFTLNMRTHIWEHPYQRRWRPGAPRASWRAAWGMDSPAQMCCFASSWECLWAPGSTYTCNLRSCVTPSNRKWGLSFTYVMWSVHRWEKKSGSPQTFTLSIFLSLVIKLVWSWKGASQKQLVIKVWAEGNWGTN